MIRDENEQETMIFPVMSNFVVDNNNNNIIINAILNLIAMIKTHRHGGDAPVKLRTYMY